ncbi:hypothetical protein ACF3NR_02605 [Vaginella massiliensis]|uniref:hypothetical protein n=1 Tax=Vaginella massiliensis TaxID=1816680 RepID=UPI000837D25A|nr:hypothetical protein [Vaginella massiliensis]
MQIIYKKYSLLFFIVLLLSVPMNNYLHILQHQQSVHKDFPPHQCSDFIHFNVYLEPDNFEPQLSLWTSFADSPHEPWYSFGLVVQKIMHKSYVRGPPKAMSSQIQPSTT